MAWRGRCDRLERGYPLGGKRLYALLDQARIDFGSRLVDAEFDNREVGRGGLEIIADGEAGQIELHLVEFLETAAEVNEQKIALVAKQRKQRALSALGGRLQCGECSDGLLQDFGAGGIR